LEKSVKSSTDEFAANFLGTLLTSEHWYLALLNFYKIILSKIAVYFKAFTLKGKG
jgi:hypothetical protein